MVFRRLHEVMTAGIHELIDTFEEPEMMLKQSIREMEIEISKAETTIAKQTTLADKFQSQANEARKLTAKRMGQAQLAIDAGEEELARQALHSKLQYEEQVQQYEKLHAEADRHASELMKQLDEMKERYQLLKDRKQATVAQAEAAKAKEKISHTLANLNYERILSGFERIEAKIMEKENLSNLRNTNETYEVQMAKFEQAQAVEEELKKMKA